MNATDLLTEIARCPNVMHCKTHPDSQHPCNAIVAVQQAVPLSHHQMPEPWSGHLERARILFLGSNPSISGEEKGFSGPWSDEDLDDFYSNRFDGRRAGGIKDGRYLILSDDTVSRHPVAFWSSIRLRAAELLGIAPADVCPGTDYAISEAVHCKSRNEIGVWAAFDTCVDMYLKRVVALSGASVIVCLGAHAARGVRRVFDVPPDVKIFGPIEVGRQERMFARLPHPAAFKVPKSFAKNLLPEDFAQLQSFLRPHEG